jgi:hypothetical protein
MDNFKSPLSQQELKTFFHPPIQRSVLFNKDAHQKKKEKEKEKLNKNSQFKKIEGNKNFSILVRNSDTKDSTNKRSFDNVLNKKKQNKNSYKKNSRRRNDYDDYYDYDNYYDDDYYRKSNYRYPDEYSKRDRYQEKNIGEKPLKKQDSMKKSNHKPNLKSIKQPRKNYRNKRRYKQVSS